MGWHSAGWRDGGCRDGGYASVMGAMIVAGIAMVFLSVIATIELIAQRHSAQAAADLAALAGAQVSLADPNGACQIAETMAREHGFTLSTCRVVDADIVVCITAPARWGGIVLGDMRVVARAGPARNNF